MRFLTMVALALCAALPMSGESEAGRSSSVGGNPQGTPVAGADKAAVQSAINMLSANGYGPAAEQLQTLLDNCKICKENNQDLKYGAASWMTCSKKIDMDQSDINVNCSSLKAATSVLAGMLFHELLHYWWHHKQANHSHAGGHPGITYDALHCQIFWKEYWWNRKICTGFASVGVNAEDKKQACQRMAVIGRMYPHWFAAQKVKFPPNGTPKKRKKIHRFPTKDVGTISAGGYTGWMLCVDNTVTQDWFDPDPTAPVTSVGTTILTLTMDEVRDVEVWEKSNGDVFAIAVGGNTAETVGEIRILTDTDGDQVVDTSTSVTLPSSTLQNPIDVCVYVDATGNDRWYILDRGADTIWNFTDSNSDDIPDTLGAAYATSSLSANIVDAESLFAGFDVDALGNQVGPFIAVRSLPDWWSAYEPYEWIEIYMDFNGDDVAETTPGKYYEKTVSTFKPSVWTGGCEGDTMWELFGPEGNVLAVYTRNPITLMFTTLVGSGISTGNDRIANVTVVPALSLGTEYVVRDDDTGIESDIITTGSQVIQVGSIAPTYVANAGGGQVTITGLHFPANVGVCLEFMDGQGDVVGSTVKVSLSSVTSTELKFFAPMNPLTQTSATVARVRIVDPGTSNQLSSWYLEYR